MHLFYGLTLLKQATCVHPACDLRLSFSAEFWDHADTARCHTPNVAYFGSSTRGVPPTYNLVIDSVTDLVYTFMYI